MAGDSGSMDQERADSLARQRNLELGRLGVNDRYYIAVERATRGWEVDLRAVGPERRPLRARVVDTVVSILTGG